MKLFLLVTLMTMGSSLAQDANKLKSLKMYQKVKKNFPDIPELRLSEVDALLKSGEIQFIDVRDAEERNVSIISGAINKKDFEAYPGKYKGKKIVVYCTIGHRSAKYIRSLRKKGINAYNLEGSILGWVHDGRSIVNLKGTPVKTLHVYGRSWNYLPKGFKGEW